MVSFQCLDCWMSDRKGNLESKIKNEIKQIVLFCFRHAYVYNKSEIKH